MCSRKLIIGCSMILLIVISYYVLSNYLMSSATFKDVGPYYSFGPENVGMYLMAQQRMQQGLDPNYAAPLKSKFADVSLLLPNGVRQLETFIN
jgi:hypothetical protein